MPAAAIFCGGLMVVAWFAKGLPVVVIPEQILVALVRLDVVNHSGHNDFAFITMRLAQWVGLQETYASTLPGNAVATLMCRATPCVVGLGFQSFVGLAACSAIAYQYTAAGMVAGFGGSAWHMKIATRDQRSVALRTYRGLRNLMISPRLILSDVREAY
jgi:hypothetical protein